MICLQGSNHYKKRQCTKRLTSWVVWKKSYKFKNGIINLKQNSDKLAEIKLGDSEYLNDMLLGFRCVADH